MKKKVVFMGTPDFAVPVLQMLIDTMDVVLVVTQPDKCVGRKQILLQSPVKVLAQKYNIEVFQPIKIREDYERLEQLQPDLIVTCAYGQILPKEVLSIPDCGAVNVHASLLPKYRGSAPIQWAILNGDAKTGITLIYMDEGMDSGDIIALAECDIASGDDVGILHDKLSALGASLLKEKLEDILVKKVKAVPQKHEEATFAPMIKRVDEKIDFMLSGESIVQKIKAFCPWPLAYFILNGEEIKVLEATFIENKHCEVNKICEVTKDSIGIGASNGIVYLKKIKPASKKMMSVQSYLNGVDAKGLLGKKVNE